MSFDRAARSRASNLDPATSPTSVGRSTPTQRYVARVGDVQRDADHARLDAAWAQGGQGAQATPLPFRGELEQGFGTDLGHLRSTVDPDGCSALGAEAYTDGATIGFASANPSMHTVAHEIAHTMDHPGELRCKKPGPAADAKEAHADAKADDAVALAGGGMSIQSGSRMAENSYRRLFANQRAGLDRLGAALRKDSSPPSSLLADVASGVVGGAIGALLGPVGVGAASLVESKIAKKVIEKIADVVKDKAVETGKHAVKEHFAGAHKTDPADNFVEAQSLAINDAEHGAVQELIHHTDELTHVEGGPQSLATLASQIDGEAARASDLQIARAAGAYARLTADGGETARAWANDDAGGDAEKGAIEIEATYALASSLQITGSNWRGVGRETEGVVEEHGKATIGDLGSNLRVTIHTAPWGTTHFEATPSGDVVVPQKSTYQQALMHAAGVLVDGHETMRELEEGAAHAAKYLLYKLNQMPVSSLHFGG
ncbi:MAG: DUF4157 domain-containing protein [Kofleriaceae bacterium]|nr:DUF4157 domain-containing protein [Kofleriaceae bacterium]MCB9574481.1 DUF4157 domain-containing protein [Kofleriaceae bacterium]